MAKSTTSASTKSKKSSTARSAGAKGSAAATAAAVALAAGPEEVIPKAAGRKKGENALLIVESPTKAKTLKKYLGAGFEVLASKGHIKDLPKKMGIDVQNDFAETYQVIEGKEKVVAELKGAAQKADVIYLATDPDREGEAIAVHIAEELKSLDRPMHRVLFHEITKRGVTDGIADPQKLNESLYEAQRTRRILDRIVGYDVSALVWSKVAFGLSAGRVQSVALRLIVDREREIEAFVPEEYWNIGVALLGASKPSFVGRLTHGGEEKIEVTNGETAEKVRTDLQASSFSVKTVARREQKRNAPAPYTTSKLQQDATSVLRFTAKRTMQVAQGLYEGVDLGKDGGPVGLITYMRTDSTRVSDDAITEVRTMIAEQFGPTFVPEKPNTFKSKKNTQDAHEAIRPASLELPPELVQKHLKDEQFKLYKLIWDRFVASQMPPAVYDQTAVDLEAKVAGAPKLHPTYTLRASGRVLKFAGWLEQYGKGMGETELAGEEDDGDDKKPSIESLDEKGDGSLPPLNEGERLVTVDPPGVLAEQKFTQPPARFNEGSLVRELEKRGIGRPSTYAEIISKVQARDYVEKLQSGGFKPSFLGKIVVDGLVAANLDFMDPAFTSSMEEQLDAVEAGSLDRVDLLKKFYARFRDQLDLSKKAKRWNPEPVDTGEVCDLCGEGTMFKRWSKNGYFLGCSNYPKCKNTRNIAEDGTAEIARETVITCEKCHDAKMVMKSGRFGSFLGCGNYPKCDGTRPVPLGIQCPVCGGDLIEVKPKKRGGRTFWGCSNYSADPSCEFKLWQRPIREPCPNCGAGFLVAGGTKTQPLRTCVTEGCGYSRPLATEEPVVPPSEPPKWLFGEEPMPPKGKPFVPRNVKVVEKKADKATDKPKAPKGKKVAD
jgi:DNA topoisomerase I